MAFTTTWIGDCSAWECDELGHLNMSFYFAKFEQARMGLFVRLGLADAFTPDAHSTVRARDVHIKYLAEARPGSPLRVESALVSLHGDGTARVGHVMYHRDGRIAATLNEIVEHVYLAEDKVFAWPSRLRDRADAFTDTMPAPARARNLSLDWALPARNRDALVEAGAQPIGGGVFLPDDAAAAGHIPVSRLFRRITTSLGWYGGGWPEFEDEAYAAAGGSAVVLEIRVRQPAYARAGTAYAIIPAVVGAEHYIRTIMHNVVDAVTGESLLTGYAAGGLFDLNTRKLTLPTDAQRAALQSRALSALAPPAA